MSEPTHHSSPFTHHYLHLPNHRQDHRPATHFFSKVPFELRAHFFLHHLDVAQLVGPAGLDQLHELCADLVEHVAAGVDMHQAAGDDLGVAHQLSVRVQRHHHDHEAVLREVLAVAHHHLRHLLRLGVDEHLAVRHALFEHADVAAVDLH